MRRDTDLPTALALGADADLAGGAPLYGLRRSSVRRALEILKEESLDAIGFLGARSRSDLGLHLLA